MKWMRRHRTEVWLGGTGVTLALSAFLFAAYMISDTNRAPGVFGAEHLMIFARPSTPDADRTHSMQLGTATARRQDADDMPVGSIDRPAGAPSGPAGSPPRLEGAPQTLTGRTLPGLRVRGIFNGQALVQTSDGLIMIGPGSTVPNIGTVLSIEPREGTWVVVTDKGVITPDPSR